MHVRTSGLTLRFRLAPLYTFAFLALCAACVSIGWWERNARLGYVGDWLLVGELFVSIVAGPCRTFKSFAYGRGDAATTLILATPTLVALGWQLTKPSRESSICACLGIAWWFLWGFAISHIGV